MLYADVAALRARFDRDSNPELTQLTGGPGADGPDVARLTQALTEASGEMDDAFRARYAVPLVGLGASTTERLAQVCCDIARYRLWSDAASDEVVRRYEQAYTWLRDVAACRFLIESPGESDDTPAPAKAGPRTSRPTLTQRREDAQGS
jgi:phage gp36-like protein